MRDDLDICSLRELIDYIFDQLNAVTGEPVVEINF